MEKQEVKVLEGYTVVNKSECKEGQAILREDIEGRDRHTVVGKSEWEG